MTEDAEIPPPRVTQQGLGEQGVVPGPLVEPHLADTSVWSKVRTQSALADWFNAEARAGRIVTCGVVVLELLRSARNTVSFRAQSEMLEVLERCPEGATQFARAREVQALLADQGRHRGIPPADLLIAASAEAASVPILHYDHDYDLIAEVSGQIVRWVMPAGSLP
ncbi:MAG: PIN domain-containing protein [Pseudonocardiaceae bacterium]